ncbi:MAG: hypothetical protein P4L46_24900 [Fimbriimonas sp.]|nr:hypothetical protein [Fimbriimonas sp.]
MICQSWQSEYQGFVTRITQHEPIPLILIRAANYLIALGERDAGECVLRYGKEGTNLLLSELLRCLYLPKKPGGYLPTPMIGAIIPSRPSNQSRLPFYPVMIFQGFPFDLVQGVLLGGARRADLIAAGGTQEGG